MFPVSGSWSSPAIRLPRRRALELGTIPLLGAAAGLGAWPGAEAAARETVSRPPRARSCVFVFLFGGPSHIDLWDMKPHAPVEIRGDFQAIDTVAPGISICEHLPQLARRTDKLCLLRSMTHAMNVHGPACSEMYSGRPYFGPPVTDQATPQDWPSVASLVARFGERRPGLPNSVVLPWYSQFVGQDRKIAGQTGGRMGEEFSPFLVAGNPLDRTFGVDGLALDRPEYDARRFQARSELRARLADTTAVDGPMAALLGNRFDEAARMIAAGTAAEAFQLHREPDSARERYGRTKFGQSLLAARRLVEAGVSLLTVNWDDDSRFDKVSPHWDTHHQNFSKLRDGLCPPFDQAFSAFLDDLSERGLLESTLVVVTGEFGRSPRIGQVTQNGMTEKTGRDHWPHAFTILLAGGGVAGGRAYGATTSNGGYVADAPVTPADLSTTILSHLGIDPAREYDDRFQHLRQVLSEGRLIEGLG